MNPNPHYEHDCAKCIYLGDVHDSGLLYDLYFCTQGKTHKLPTIVCRASSTPEDYVSGLLLASVSAAAREGLARAVTLGLISAADAHVAQGGNWPEAQDPEEEDD